MADGRIEPQEILLPVRAGFIVLTLVAALLLNLLPWSGLVLWGKPDFVALLGLFMDVADGTLFGQHALAYSILAYAGIVLHRRVLRFSGTSQVLHVVTLLLMNDLIVLAIRAAAGADFPGYRYFLGSFVAGILWLPLGVLLKLPQRPRLDPDRV